MKYQLLVLNNRLTFLQKELDNRLTVLETENNFTRIEITINGDGDILSVFHAGVMCGDNAYRR
jgi:hypothetical protein